jgi:predicted dehydrogenase
MKTIRWGIIGAGSISSTFATALNATNGAELVAVASRDLLRARNFAKEFHIPTAYSSYEEIVTDDNVEVIYIGTPHSEHIKNVELCIKSKKHVLCEKAFTLNEKDTTYLINLAKEYNVFLMEAMWTKLLPTTIMVKDWINSGRIGTLKYLSIRFGFFNERNVENRFFNLDLGGGALLDVGIYPVTYAVHMMEQLPKSIQSSALIGFTGVDEVNSILLQFENGAIADLSSSINVEVGKDALLVGEKGKIIVENFWKAERAELFDNEGNLLEVCDEPFQVNGYEYEVMEVNQCIREAKIQSDIVPLQATKDIMRILDTLRGQWNMVYPKEQL